jgi:hypothetical protein
VSSEFENLGNRGFENLSPAFEKTTFNLRFRGLQDAFVVGFRECTRDLDGEVHHVGVTILHPWLFELLLSRLTLSHSHLLKSSRSRLAKIESTR